MVETYSVRAYGRMIANSRRTDAYAKALEKVVKPGSIVADIGTGIGIFAFLACKFGAGHVYAIEPSDAIHVAKKIANDNGFRDRITFFQNISTKVNLPERVDIVVSDIRGVLPLHQRHIPSIIDARERFLSSDGTIIPNSDSMWISIVNAPEKYRNIVSPWGDNTYNLDMKSAQKYLVNQTMKTRIKPEQLITEPLCWEEIEYATIENPNVKSSITWDAKTSSTGHGLLIWFDANLWDGIHFSNAPHYEELIYGSKFFPWLEPVDISKNDMITVSIYADLVGDEYIWRWETEIIENINSKILKASFKQSTFYSSLYSLKNLHKRESFYKPLLNNKGKTNHKILSMMDGKHTLSDIAIEIYKEYPFEFTDEGEVIEWVRELSESLSL